MLLPESNVNKICTCFCIHNGISLGKNNSMYSGANQIGDIVLIALCYKVSWMWLNVESLTIATILIRIWTINRRE